MCSISYLPDAMPAAMRRAIMWVLPQPAPASTSMLRSRSDTIRRRDRSSLRGLLMRQLPVSCRQLGVRQLDLDAIEGVGRAARGSQFAVLARVLARGVNERTGGDHFAQI